MSQPSNAPQWLLDIVRSGKPEKPSIELPAGSKFSEGGRHAALLKEAGRLANTPNITFETFSGGLNAFDQAYCSPPKGAAAVQKLAADVWQRYRKTKPDGSTVYPHYSALPSIFDCGAPQMNYLLDGLIPSPGVTLLTGRAGDGKTMVAGGIAAAVARGRHFAGLATQKRAVLVLDRENPPAELRQRYETFGVKPSDPIYIWGSWVEPGPEVRVETVETFAAETQGLVIVDSAIAFHPGNENDASETRAYLKWFRQLSSTTGCSILLIHHKGKGPQAASSRGSSDFEASVDLAFEIVRDPEQADGLGSFTLKAFKRRMLGFSRLDLRFSAERGFERDVVDADGGLADACAYIRSNPGALKSDIEEHLTKTKSWTRQQARSMLDRPNAPWVVKIGLHNRRHFHMPDGTGQFAESAENQRSGGELVEFSK